MIQNVSFDGEPQGKSHVNGTADDVLTSGIKSDTAGIEKNRAGELRSAFHPKRNGLT